MASEGAVEVVVGSLPGGDAKIGVVSLGVRGSTGLAEVGIEAGSFVALRREDRAVYSRVVWRLDRRAPAPGEVQMDEWQRQELAAAVGDRVELTPVAPGDVEELSEIDLAVSAEPTSAIPPRLLAGFMAAKKFPVYPGFRFEFSPLGTGETLTFMVRRCRAVEGEVDFGVCTGETRLHIRVSGDEEGLTDLTVSYDDIGGLDAEIDLVRRSVELPIRMRNSIRQLGVSAPRGIIFHGPPGTGKTLLARALANAAGVRVFEPRGQELLSQNPDKAQKLLNDIFDEAEAESRGSVILLDELDAIAGKREDPVASRQSGLVTALLTRLDGLRTRGNVTVIGTTNRIDSIDEALRRHGRFSREIYVSAPSEDGRLQILEIHARRMSLACETEEEREELLRGVARDTLGFVGADLMELCRQAGINALCRAHPLEALDRGCCEPQETLSVTREDFRGAATAIKPSALKEVIVSVPDVSFDDIGGLDDIIRDIKERVMEPLRHPEVFAEMGLTPEKGILLYGPPGTGKTMLAKAIAKECKANFIAVQGPELMSKWVGESEEGVRRVFSRARQLAPAIIFMDEIEALIPARGRHEGDSGVSDRVVNQFLAELDGVVELKQVLVIGATNRAELVDNAAVRPGRLGAHIYVPLPDEKGRAAVLKLYLGQDLAPPSATPGQSMEGGVGGSDRSRTDFIEEVAGDAEGLSGADLAGICREAKLIALREVGFERASPVTQEHLREALENHQERAPLQS